MNEPDKICDWCKLWEERLWRIFVLLSTAITLASALLVAFKHLPIGHADSAPPGTDTQRIKQPDAAHAEARVGDRDDEPHDGARGVKLAGIARRIAHRAQHGFVERAQRVQFVAGGETNAVEVVDNIAPIVAVGTGQRAQVTEETRAFLATRQRSLFVVDEREQFVASDAVGFGRPTAPAVRRFDGGLELFAGQLGLALALNFQVIQKFQKHDPSEHREAIQIPVQAFVFPHYIACGLEQCSQGLSCCWRAG